MWLPVFYWPLIFYYCLLPRELFSYSVVWWGIVPEPTTRKLYFTRQHYRKTDFQLKLKVNYGGNWWLANCLSDNIRMYMFCYETIDSPFAWFMSLPSICFTCTTFYPFKYDDMIWCAQKCFSMTLTSNHSNNNWHWLLITVIITELWTLHFSIHFNSDVATRVLLTTNILLLSSPEGTVLL